MRRVSLFLLAGLHAPSFDGEAVPDGGCSVSQFYSSRACPGYGTFGPLSKSRLNEPLGVAQHMAEVPDVLVRPIGHEGFGLKPLKYECLSPCVAFTLRTSKAISSSHMLIHILPPLLAIPPHSHDDKQTQKRNDAQNRKQPSVPNRVDERLRKESARE